MPVLKDSQALPKHNIFKNFVFFPGNDDDSGDSDSHDEEEDDLEGNDRIVIESSDVRDDDAMPGIMGD